MEPEWMKTAREKGIIKEGKTVNAAAFKGPQSISEAAIEVAGKFLETASESQFQECVIILARNQGWRVAHFRKVRVQRRDGTVFWETPVAADGKGFLDLELVRGKQLIKAELKVGKNKPTEEQEGWIAAYREARIAVFLWYPSDWPEIVKLLTQEKAK